MPQTKEDLNVMCRDIQLLDNSIRFVGIANNLGSLIGKAYRNGLTPLMDENETSHYSIQAVLRAATRQDFESKIGRLEYSIGKYERLIRATVPIRLNLDEESKFYLLLSFDLKSAALEVIEDKVFRFIQENKENFA